MRQHLVLYNTKKWDELTDAEKEKCWEKNYGINVDYYDWWEFCYEDFKERLKKIGVECESFYFDLDRANYIYMDKPYVFDERLFLKGAGCDLRLRDNRELIKHGISIETNHYGGGSARNYCYEDAHEVDLTRYLNEVLEEFLSDLRKEWEYQTSLEGVGETMECNEYDILPETGEIF